MSTTISLVMPNESTLNIPITNIALAVNDEIKNSNISIIKNKITAIPNVLFPFIAV